MTDKWLAKEIELNCRHESILMRREAMLSGAETYYDTEQQQSASFISDITKAIARNNQFLMNVDKCYRNLEEDSNGPETPKFHTIKNNYWVMVKNVFPVWHKEQRAYELSHVSNTKHNSCRSVPADQTEKNT